MGRPQSTPIEDLRRAIDCLPRRTREAMLEGITSGRRIIVGAYSDRRGGQCPMLAAHRCGGRTNFISFARAWDRFAGAGKRSRPATDRELLVLRSHLEASLLADDRADELAAAVADHQALARERRAREARRTGLGWLRRRPRLEVPDEALERELQPQ